MPRYTLLKEVKHLFQSETIEVDMPGQGEFAIGFDPRIRTEIVEYLEVLLDLDFSLKNVNQIVIFQDMETISVQVVRESDEEEEIKTELIPTNADGEGSFEIDFKYHRDDIIALLKVLYDNDYPIYDVMAKNIPYRVETIEH